MAQKKSELNDVLEPYSIDDVLRALVRRDGLDDVLEALVDTYEPGPVGYEYARARNQFLRDNPNYFRKPKGHHKATTVGLDYMANLIITKKISVQEAARRTEEHFGGKVKARTLMAIAYKK